MMYGQTGIAFVLSLLLSQAIAIAEPPTKILFVGKEPDHPYGTHMYMHVGKVLAACVELTPDVTTVVSQGWPQDPALTKDVSAMVLYSSPGAEFLLDSPYRSEFEKLMESGAGLVTIHWASSIREENLERLGATWLDCLGGTWVSNVGLSKGESLLTQLMPDHPICRGWDEYVINDEYYLNPTIRTAKPLLRISDPAPEGKDVVVGWVHERPNGGRTFSTTLGHPYSNFQRMPFRRMVVNAILWSAGRELPTTGANVAIHDDLLALPPAN